MTGQNWTKEELEKLHEHYSKMPNKELQEKYLPNRTVKSIRQKASELGITLANRLGWTEEELEKLQEYYGKISIEELQKTYLPDRTVEAIVGKASGLGITLPKSPDWTEEELEKLQEYYGKISNEELQRTCLPGRTIPAIVGKAGLIGIGLTRSPDWTKEDDEKLKKYYGKMPNKELQGKYLPNRTLQTIWNRASRLGISSPRSPDWTEEELEKLLKHYNKMSIEELREKHLSDRTKSAIKGKARILGIASKRGSIRANEEKKANPDSDNHTSALLSTTHSSTQFSDWLAQNIELPESSIVAYSDAVGTISKEMHQKGTIQKPLENMSPFELDFAISRIISDTDFSTKDTREKHRYSNALKQYRYFLNTTVEDSGDHAYMEIIKNDRQIPETEKTAIIQSRRGQGVFRKSLIDKYNGRCIITGIEHPKLLVASHIKPWAASSNKERLSVSNGLLLSATYDRLFDSGLITFDSDGKIFLSSLIGDENIKRLGLSQGMRFDLQINESMEEYLSYHRNELFVE
ncbi:MAG: HNH endonuclease [Butyricicoccus sp.]|nr:HNH endonuclease [Butyricicoccus sp.]MCM1237723.1 HNH endonuclease [Ruminococcus flavefaciens]